MSTVPSRGVVEQRRRPLQDRSRATVSFVLEAAAQLFEEIGYDAVTTNAVAERAGVSIGTLYQYFANKEDLLMALLEHHVASGKAAVLDLPLSDLHSVVATLVEVSMTHNTDRPDLGTLLQRDAPRSTLLEDHLSDTRHLVVNTIANGLREARPSLPNRELWVRAELASRLIEQLSHSVARDRPVGEPTQNLSAEITRLAVGYLLAPASPDDSVDGA